MTRSGLALDVGQRHFAAAVAEGVELLDIADVEAGLLLHPAAQRKLERAVAGRIERAERQAGDVAPSRVTTT